MLSNVRRTDYHSYLLRLLRADDSSSWRASLQSTASGETRTFADFEGLCAFLLREMDSRTPEEKTPSGADAQGVKI